VSKSNDNTPGWLSYSWQGTTQSQLRGRYAWVAAGEHGLAGVEVTEREEPQAVFGSTLHALAFPGKFAEHLKRGLNIKYAT